MPDAPSHPLALIARECGITTADVRKTLIADSYTHFDRTTHLIADARTHGGLNESGLAALDAHSAASAYAYLLAALLRIIEDRHGEDEALGLAAMVDAVRESGTDVLEVANDDLDERAMSDHAKVAATLGTAKPGQGKSQAAAEMVCGFELEDGSVAYFGVGGAE